MDLQESQLDTRPEDLPQSIDKLPTGAELTQTVVEATRRVLRRRFRILLLIRDAYAHLESNAEALTAVWDDLRTALRLLLAWTQRSYRQVSGASIVLLVGALVYFVTRHSRRHRVRGRHCCRRNDRRGSAKRTRSLPGLGRHRCPLLVDPAHGTALTDWNISLRVRTAPCSRTY